MPDSMKSPIPDILEPQIPDVKEFLRSHTGGGGKDRRGSGGGGSSGQDRRGSGGGRGSGGDHPDKGGKKKSEKGKGTASCIIRREDLELHFGSKREDVAKILDVSVSTLKRVCRDKGIPRRQNRASNSVGRPPDQHGERNTSTACKTPLHNVHARMEGEPDGQNQEANEFQRDLIEHSIALNTENDSTIAVYSETEAARGSSKWAFQLEGQTMQYTTYPYHNDLVFSQPQIASIEVPNENMGSLQDRRDLLASQVVAAQQEPLSEGNVFGFGNWTVGSCSDLAPTQPMHPFSHATGSSENLENLLASVDEHFMEGNVSGSSMSDPALSQPMRTIHHTMAIPYMMPLPTERQDKGSVKIEATYQGDNIKFQFPLTSGIKELKEVMSKTLERKLGSFKVKYKDEDGEWILMGLDEHVREYQQLLLGNKVTTKLKVQNKVPNTTNCDNCKCNNCRSLKRKRP
ncbi:protein NLP2-like [Rhododendron vialii]|uniref:protein NLP2-like n=1 Tax=Rhododendron vialii TaxID=182163 RepID=UPI00265E9DFC|nr:protein NLP2-like [Rhododendron vialii]